MKWNIIGAIFGVLGFILVIMGFGFLTEFVWTNYEPNFFISLIGILIAVSIGGLIYNKIKNYGHNRGGSVEDDEKFEKTANTVRLIIAGAILLFILLMVIYPVITGNDLIENDVYETYNKNGIYFNYTVDWELYLENNDTVVVSLTDSSSGESKFVLIKDKIEGITLEEFEKEFYKVNSIKVINSTNMSIDGNKAIDVYSKKGNENYRSIFLIKDGYLYNLNFYSDDFTKNPYKMDIITKSFHFT